MGYFTPVEGSVVYSGAYRDAVIRYINDYWREQFRSPTLREICDACDIPSTSTMHYILSSLTREGIVEMTPNTSRSIVPVWVRVALSGPEAA